MQIKLLEQDRQADAVDLVEFFEQGQNRVFDEKPNFRYDAGDAQIHDFLRHSILENWKKFKIGVAFYFSADLTLAGEKAKNYLVRLDPAPKDLTLNYVGSSIDFDINDRVLNRSRSDKKGAMLVPVAELVKMPEASRRRVLPAMVRLYTFDETQHAARAPLESGRFLGLKPLVGAAYRELYGLLFSVVSRFGQGENQVIQCGSQMVDQFASNNAEHWGERSNIIKSENQPPILVLLSGESVEVRTQEVLGHLIKQSGVFFCSHKLPSNLL